jgi:hypothetical protein
MLISGFSKTGKTTSFPTFIYGPYDHTNPDEQEDAYSYAGDKKMVILVAPGEYGILSLPLNTPHITSYYYETDPDEECNSVKWSIQALKQFDSIYANVIKNHIDILIIDGLHSLWSHLMNRTTGGEYLAGVDLNINKGGNVDPYRSARFHSQTHNAFGQYVAQLYNSQIPLIVCTTWEDWETGQQEGQRGDITASRYLWPSIPGKMGKEVVGKFDARVSAQIKRKCLHSQCDQKNQDHYVWQIYPDAEVKGVGIKGIKVNKSIKDCPFIHQNYRDLQELIKVCS